MGSASDFYAQYLLDSLSQLGVTGLPDWQGLEPGRVDIGVLDQAWQLGLDQIGPDVALRVGALVTRPGPLMCWGMPPWRDGIRLPRRI